MAMRLTTTDHEALELSARFNGLMVKQHDGSFAAASSLQPIGVGLGTGILPQDAAADPMRYSFDSVLELIRNGSIIDSFD